jgi:hypothetical protein
VKLRTRHNSIRLRLTRSEVKRFAKTGHVDETIEFGPAAGGRLVYELAAGGECVAAAITAGRISIFVPREAADDWTKTERVGISGEQAIGGGRQLSILVEKDFACLEPRPGDEDADAFAHPLSVVGAGNS